MSCLLRSTFLKRVQENVIFQNFCGKWRQVRFNTSMHRLREWFGIKDWQGPQKQSILDPTHEENKEEKTATAPSLVKAEKIEEVKPKPRDKPDHPLYDKAEVWLKQYIPHKEGTCYSCKLIALTTTVIYGSFSAGLCYSFYKKVEGRNKILLIMSGVGVTAMSISFFCMTVNDESPFEPFMKKLEEKKRKNSE